MSCMQHDKAPIDASVSFRIKVDSPDMLPGVMGGVNAAEHQFSPGAGGVVPVEPEGEYGLRHQSLIHHVLEWGRHSPNRDLRERQPLHTHNQSDICLADFNILILMRMHVGHLAGFIIIIAVCRAEDGPHITIKSQNCQQDGHVNQDARVQQPPHAAVGPYDSSELCLHDL